MTTEQEQELASLYVAGAATAEEHRAFEAALRDNPVLRELVRSLQQAASLLAIAAPSVSLPPELRNKVLHRIDAEITSSKPKSAPATTQSHRRPGFQFVGADDSRGWKALPLPGAWIKLLSLERDRGYAVLLGRLEAGVRYPAHIHAGAEEIYILTGDLHVGDRALGPGDFHHADAGTAHPVNYSIEGCTLLAVLPSEHELVKLAMA
jgi:quercetin dioxygenase-like cupin family protein